MISANEMISRNIKRIRQERNLTLDDLARLSGVSKSMLSEIERCTKSPTISMLEKICTGINVPLAQLTYMETPEVSVIKKSTTKHYSTSEGFDTYNLFEYDPDKKFEILRHVIAPIPNGCLSIMKRESENTLFVRKEYWTFRWGKEL